MIFKQFYEPSLGHASYLIGSEQTGEALVLDARRDVQNYYDYAREQGLRISYATDTHQHNDYLSGICELKQRSELELLAGARAELGYRARRLDDGATLEIGEVTLEIVHTPGHTPEHISLIVRDRSRGEEPLMLLSGGALLVDDVARPDLLGSTEETRKHAGEMITTLKDKILPLPDHVMVFPTHVSGSLCGGNIGSMLFTTIGYERRLNDILKCVQSMKLNVTEAGNRRATDDIGFFVPLSVLQEKTAVAIRRARDLNADDPYVTVHCGSELATFTESDDGWLMYRCEDGSVPM